MVNRLGKGTFESLGSDAKQVYEPPVLTVIGNLRDLLAGNASKLDDNDTCGPGGTHSTPDC
jgi:hypothetical protein